MAKRGGQNKNKKTAWIIVLIVVIVLAAIIIYNYSSGRPLFSPPKQTCQDSDNTIYPLVSDINKDSSYLIKGYVRFRVGARTLAENDTCSRSRRSNTSIIIEKYCSDKGGRGDAIKTCPNGCQDGACIIQTSEIDGCSLISQQIKGNITYLQSTGRNVTLKEGEKTYKYNYVVIPGYLLRITSIVNSTYGYSQDRVQFFDYISGSMYKTTITGEGIGKVWIGGNQYSVNYYGASTISGDDRYVILDFPQTSGNVKMTFYCS